MTSVLTAVITLAMVPFLGIISMDLNYSCNPSGIITVANPDSSTYIGAHAETQDQSQNCTVHVISFMSVVMITDCPISKNISFWLLKTSGLPAVLTDDIDYHILRCQQIPNTGAMRLLTDKSWVTNHISTTYAPTVTPKILLTTQFEDMETGDVKEVALVGESVMWEIEGPAGYTVLPLNCTANAGTGDGCVNIVLNGCSLDTYLLSHFEYKSETEKHILVAELFAFRFASSSEVVVICDMLGCTNTSSACDFDCPSERRKRDKFGQHPTDYEQSHAQQSEYRRQRSNDLYGNPSESETSQIYGEVRARLTVYSSSEYFVQLENGSHALPRTSNLTTVSILLILSTLVYKLNM